MVSERSKKAFAKGEIIFKEGDVGKEMHIIQTGEVVVIKNIGDGDSVILARLKKGDFFGEMSILGDEKRSATIKAIEDTTTIMFDDVIFRSQLRKLPDWFTSMFKVLTKRIRDMNNKIISRFRMGIQFSVLNIFYLVTEKFGTVKDDKVVIDNNLVVEKIQDILGIAGADITAILNEIESDGIIEINKDNNQIHILDKKKLIDLIAK